jgi:hypothetical protein
MFRSYVGQAVHLQMFCISLHTCLLLPESIGDMHGTMQMLSLVISLLQAVERAAGSEGQKITYNIIKQRLGDILYRLV